MKLKTAMALWGLTHIARHTGLTSLTTMVKRWLTLLTLWGATGATTYALWFNL